MKKFSSFLLVLLFTVASSFAAGLEYPRGVVDYDGQVSISDATCPLVSFSLKNQAGARRDNLGIEPRCNTVMASTQVTTR